MTFKEELTLLMNKLGKVPTISELTTHFKDWQLPRPLPEVPQFVADWIKYCKKKHKPFQYAIHSTFLRDFLLEQFSDNDSRVRWLDDEENALVFARAWSDGYTVVNEK